MGSIRNLAENFLKNENDDYVEEITFNKDDKIAIVWCKDKIYINMEEVRYIPGNVTEKLLQKKELPVQISDNVEIYTLFFNLCNGKEKEQKESE